MAEIQSDEVRLNFGRIDLAGNGKSGGIGEHGIKNGQQGLQRGMALEPW